MGASGCGSDKWARMLRGRRSRFRRVGRERLRGNCLIGLLWIEGLLLRSGSSGLRTHALELIWRWYRSVLSHTYSVGVVVFPRGIWVQMSISNLCFCVRVRGWKQDIFYPIIQFYGILFLFKFVEGMVQKLRVMLLLAPRPFSRCLSRPTLGHTPPPPFAHVNFYLGKSPHVFPPKRRGRKYLEWLFFGRQLNHFCGHCGTSWMPSAFCTGLSWAVLVVRNPRVELRNSVNEI